MKQAKVIEVRDVGAPISCDPAFSNPAHRARAELLLRRYPDTDADETAEIVDFLVKGQHLDVGVVSADPLFEAKIAVIRYEHRRRFRAGAIEGLWFLLLLVLPLALVCWLPQLLGRH